MLIDINKCIGCNYCTYACQAVNNLADDMLYNVVTTETTQSGEEFFLSRPCMQCEEAPCVHVCPVGATYYRADGIVAMDYTRCIGCRYCQVACPYGARVFNWRDPIETSPKAPTFGTQEVENRPRGVVEKCHFCSHRIDYGVERGLVPGVDEPATPACVVACPTGARVFGDLTDPTSPISTAQVEASVTLRLREDLSTEPRVYYVSPVAESQAPFIQNVGR
jgi:Fe-S-cluster-containing dehydrogenase component